MGDGALAITGHEADKLLAPLATYDGIVLAVSGGPDSMALMHLVAEWSGRHPKPSRRILVVTVDHGLRRESAGEASFVADWATRLELPCRIVRWEGEKPARGLPAAARAARYELLEGESTKLGTSSICLVTAHTQDDQAETVLMRLKRGSGIDGLSAMAPRTSLREGSAVSLLRPLLPVPKARLIATLEARGQTWAEDPSNTCLDYERPAVRAALARLADEGISAGAIAISARRLRAAREAVDYALARFTETLALSFNDEIFASLSRAAFDEGPEALRARVLAHLIGRFGGTSLPPQLAEVEDLTARLAADTRTTSTLGGAVVSATPRDLKIWREPGRIAAAPLTLRRPGIWEVWDRRFRVRSVSGDVAVHVCALGEAARRETVAPLLDPRRPLPAAAVAALPAFWAGDRLLSVPTLKAYMQSNRAAGLDAAGTEACPLFGQ